MKRTNCGNPRNNQIFIKRLPTIEAETSDFVQSLGARTQSLHSKYYRWPSPSNAPMKPAKKKAKPVILSDDSEAAVSQSSDEDNADLTSHHHEDEKV
jgi:hypothetical protein